MWTSSRVNRIGVTAGLDPSGILDPDRLSINSTASSMAPLCVTGIDSGEGIGALNIDQYTHFRSSSLRIADHGTFLNLQIMGVREDMGRSCHECSPSSQVGAEIHSTRVIKGKGCDRFCGTSGVIKVRRFIIIRTILR